MILNAFKPTAAKIVGLIVIFALIATYAFVPSLTNPQLCSNSCTVAIGYPFDFLLFDYGSATLSFNNFIVVNFIIDFVIFYLALCLLSLIFNLGRRKNVPNSNSGGRDSSPANETGV